jgi:hypothetical protein
MTGRKPLSDFLVTQTEQLLVYAREEGNLLDPSRSFSTVWNIFDAKRRNSAQRGANPKLLNHLARATVHKLLKTHTKTLF